MAIHDNWRYTFKNPFQDLHAVNRFKDGPPGYERCAQVAQALKDAGFPMPAEKFQAAQSVAWLLEEVARDGHAAAEH